MPTRRWSALLRLPALVASGAMAASLAACSDDGGEEDDAESVTAFCNEMQRLGGERPESYVGSPEHMEDMNSLAGVAPSEIRPAARTYANFLESGQIRDDDPDTKLTENFPPDVRQAIAELMQYESANC